MSADSGRSRPRRRPRDQQPRSREVKIKLSEQEYAAIAARAAVAGLTIPGYLAERGVEPVQSTASISGLTPVQRRGLAAEVFALKRILSGAGSNLNQLTRLANSTGEVRREALAYADLIARTLERYEELMNQLREWVDT